MPTVETNAKKIRQLAEKVRAEADRMFQATEAARHSHSLGGDAVMLDDVPDDLDWITRKLVTEPLVEHWATALARWQYDLGHVGCAIEANWDPDYCEVYDSIVTVEWRLAVLAYTQHCAGTTNTNRSWKDPEFQSACEQVLSNIVRGIEPHEVDV